MRPLLEHLYHLHVSELLVFTSILQVSQKCRRSTVWQNPPSRATTSLWPAWLRAASPPPTSAGSGTRRRSKVKTWQSFLPKLLLVSKLLVLASGEDLVLCLRALIVVQHTHTHAHTNYYQDVVLKTNSGITVTGWLDCTAANFQPVSSPFDLMNQPLRNCLIRRTGETAAEYWEDESSPWNNENSSESERRIICIQWKKKNNNNKVRIWSGLGDRRWRWSYSAVSRSKLKEDNEMQITLF